MGDLRILIADGSPVYKKMFMQAVTEAEVEGRTFVRYAAGGEEALALINRKIFEVIILDAEISGVGVVALLRQIAIKIPKAVVLVTARPSAKTGKLSDEVVGYGVFDFMTKPIDGSYNENLAVIKRKIAEVFKNVHGDSLKRAQRPIKATVNINAASNEKRTASRNKFKMVLIAASTGGPSALASILGKLNKGFPLPILVVQHIPQYFTESLAHNLNQKSPLRVKVAEDKETVEAGTVYIAPGGTHMTLGVKNRIHLSSTPPVNGIRPSADVLFESIAENFTGTKVLAVILTGMGHDGEKGLRALKQKLDCVCLAQSENTCVVYGMPRAAVESGLADKVLDLEDISAEIKNFITHLSEAKTEGTSGAE